MLPCQICGHKSNDIVAYVKHMRLHSSVPNVVFQCCMADCSRTFRKVAALKSHIYRHHKEQVMEPRLSLAANLTCHVDFCSATCDSLTQFYSHLKMHIKEGRTVACPFKHCDKTFTVLSSFTSHMSRRHKKCAERSLIDSITTTGVLSGADASQNSDSDLQCNMQTDACDSYEELDISPENIEKDLFLKNLALFYLKLQAKLLLPSSVIQTIIEDMQSIHSVNQSHLLFKLNEKLVILGVPEATINTVINDLKAADLFGACNSQTLKTDQRRKTVFKNSFHYVEPIPVCLGKKDAGKECFAQYVPVKQTIEALFQCTSVREQYNKVHGRSQLKEVIKDVWDGENITEKFLEVGKSSLGLILYQDAFEVVNPLGSARKKHKILAIYLTLADLLPHNRSSTDQMQLVLLCREQDFKFFGQKVVLRCLVNDLKDLENNGIVLPDGQVCKGILRAIAGDNLGSHNIGGFLENFSGSTYFCRYCDIDKVKFHMDPLFRATSRTPQSYKEHVESLGGGSVHSGGIKCDSLFNELSFFHVCQPGLPPCLGHDLFEGVVSSDLALYIQHLVTVDKQFSYLELNRRITQFKYLGNDASDRPCEVNRGSDKLGGNAVQNWCFLRLLPVLIGDNIESPDENQVWQLVLLLREIVALVCAPAISTGQIGYLRVLIDEYLHFRKNVFPDHRLKPKHHYLSHYPELIIHFGPLIRLWTLRFESKHMYFKQCARKLHNYKNLCSTLAERHQLLQSFLSAGNLFPPTFAVDRATEFFLNDYNDAIRESVSSYDFQPANTLIAHEASVKGTKYRKNMLVIIGEGSEGLEIGKIVKIVLHNNSEVYFITEKHKALYIHNMGIYCLTPIQSCYCCITLDSLLDYYPLPEYKMHGMTIVVLHHSFLSP